MKPRIAIPVPHSDAAYSERNLPSYVSAVEQSGGEAVVLALGLPSVEVAQMAKTCDAILLPGSPADVDPQKFSAPRDPHTAPADPARDNLDELLLQDAHNMRKPILGICYGIQSLNVWRNGTLVQHIESPVLHSRPEGMPKTQTLEHSAAVESGSLLEGIVGATSLRVNSSHHQSVDKPGDGLRVVSRCLEDQVIEAVEGTSPDHWVLGVQWHPERTFDTDEPSRAIFHELVKQAKAWHERLARHAPDFESTRTR